VWVVGTSGWHYADWKDHFYPPGMSPKDWLSYLSARFPSVELNNTFYRLPPEATFDRWRDLTPVGFVFSVKASRYVTHIRRLVDVEESIDLLIKRARHLQDRLGPILFQLPPTLTCDLERLRQLLSILPSDMPFAFEFRHRSWESEETFRLLDKAGAALVWPDRPGWRAHLPATGGWCYLRMHQGRRTAPDYAPSKLRRWADRLASIGTGGYVYFNNDQAAAAVRDAERLTWLLAERGAEVMPAGQRDLIA
jgi:uncharacterized protein YecE (DUF72 family)